jgi:hypothetical protein
MTELGEKFGEDAYAYIALIHPVNWTLFGNLEDLYGSESFKEFTDTYVSDNYEGQPKPLFGYRTTSILLMEFDKGYL